MFIREVGLVGPRYILCLLRFRRVKLPNSQIPCATNTCSNCFEKLVFQDELYGWSVLLCRRMSRKRWGHSVHLPALKYQKKHYDFKT